VKLTIYKFHAVARCPVRDQLDVYEAVAKSEEMIECEHIATAVIRFSTDKLFQEELTSRLAEVLRCEVTLTGTHSGVQVVSTGYGS